MVGRTVTAVSLHAFKQSRLRSSWISHEGKCTVARCRLRNLLYHEKVTGVVMVFPSLVKLNDTISTLRSHSMFLETSVSRLCIQQANFFEGLNPTTFFRSLSTQLCSSSIKKQLQGLNKVLLMIFPSDFTMLGVFLKYKLKYRLKYKNSRIIARMLLKWEQDWNRKTWGSRQS